MIRAPDNGVSKVWPASCDSGPSTATGADCIAQMLTQALKSVKDAVSITDMQDMVLFVNRSFCELYGYSCLLYTSDAADE